MKTKSNNVWLGVIIGLVVPVVAFFIYYQIEYSYHSFNRFLELLKFGQILMSIISLSVMANLPAFFIAIWKEKDLTARGILGVTLIFGLIIMILKLI